MRNCQLWNKKIFDRIFKARRPKHEKRKAQKTERLTNYIKNLEHIDCWNKLDKIYEQNINGMRIRSKCDWCEYGERSSKFFLNLEKSRTAQSVIRNITKDKKDPYMS